MIKIAYLQVAGPKLKGCFWPFGPETGGPEVPAPNCKTENDNCRLFLTGVAQSGRTNVLFPQHLLGWAHHVWLVQSFPSPSSHRRLRRLATRFCHVDHCGSGHLLHTGRHFVRNRRPYGRHSEIGFVSKSRLYSVKTFFSSTVIRPNLHRRSWFSFHHISRGYYATACTSTLVRPLLSNALHAWTRHPGIG